MKRTLLAVAVVAGMLGLNTGSGFGEEVKNDSTITAVTVYPGSARVTRQVTVELSPGTHSIFLEKIIPVVDENSITVTGKGTAQVKIFGAYLKTEYLKEAADARVKDLEKQIQDLQDKVAVENDTVDVLNQQREYLNSVRLFSGQQIPKDLVTTMPAAAHLEETMNFLSKSLADVAAKQQEAGLKVRELNREIAALSRQLNDLRNSSRNSQRSIVVDLECVKSGRLALDVSYLVGGANWRPLYDARSDYDKGQVELTSYGSIQQRTGEDWENVKLTLSTAKPTIGGRLPYVAPWILQEYQAQQYEPYYMKTNAPRMRAGVQSMAYSDDMGAVGGTAAEMTAPREAEVAYADVGQKGVSVVYQLARPVTIKSDGSESKFPVTTQTLKADFAYSTFPKASTYAYLGSRVTNAKDLQLLAGQVNLFLGDEFIGKSSIDNVGPGQDFDLYLGIDENVTVKREEISKKNDDVLIAGIQSPNLKTTIKNKLTVENNTGKAVRVILFEAMPVSQNERIKVKIYDVSQEPVKKDWQDRKGVWRWELTLEPKAKKEITYTYLVERPKDMQISGL